MRHRIYMDNGRYYDVNELPEFGNSVNQLIPVDCVGEHARKTYIAKSHISCIEEIPENVTNDRDLAWMEKNKQYEAEKSTKKFKDMVQKP